MMKERAAKIAVLVLALAALSQPGTGRAEPLKVSNPGTGSVPLSGSWQFHLGDDKAWADPALDDSDWEPIRSTQLGGSRTILATQGSPGIGYDLQIDNANSAGTKSLAVLIPVVQDAYEIYWNGQKLGTYGRLPEGAHWWAFGHETVYPLPSSSGVLALGCGKHPSRRSTLQNLAGSHKRRSWATRPCSPPGRS